MRPALRIPLLLASVFVSVALSGVSAALAATGPEPGIFYHQYEPPRISSSRSSTSAGDQLHPPPSLTPQPGSSPAGYSNVWYLYGNNSTQDCAVTPYSTPSSSSTTCDTVGSGFLSSSEYYNGSGFGELGTNSPDGCWYDSLNAALNVDDPYQLGSATALTSPSPVSAYEVTDASYGTACQQIGDSSNSWGLWLYGNANSECNNDCGIKHEASFGGPIFPWAVDSAATLGLESYYDPVTDGRGSTKCSSGTTCSVSDWHSYLCFWFQDTGSRQGGEYCAERWRSDNYHGPACSAFIGYLQGNTSYPEYECYNGSTPTGVVVRDPTSHFYEGAYWQPGANNYIIWTTLAPDAALNSQYNGSSNETFNNVFGQKYYSYTVSQGYLENTIALINAAVAHGIGGSTYSTTPSNYSSISGFEDGNEGNGEGQADAFLGANVSTLWAWTLY
jgi:hypothetical protein